MDAALLQGKTTNPANSAYETVQDDSKRPMCWHETVWMADLLL